MFIKDSGSMIKQKVRAFTSIKTALPIQANGLTINSMGMAMKNGQTELNTKAIMLKA